MSEKMVGQPLLDGSRVVNMPFDDVLPLGKNDIGLGFFIRLADKKVVRSGGNKFLGIFKGTSSGTTYEFVVSGSVPACVPAGYDNGVIKNGDHLTIQASGEFTKAIAGQLVVAVAIGDSGRDVNDRESVAVNLLEVGQFVETDPVAPMGAMSDDELADEIAKCEAVLSDANSSKADKEKAGKKLAKLKKNGGV